MARSKSRSTSSSRREPASSPPTWDERLIQWLLPWRKELAGLLLFAVAGIILLGLVGLTESGLLRLLTSYLQRLFGWGAIPVALIVAGVGLNIALGQIERPYQVRPSQLLGVELLLLAALSFSHWLFGSSLSQALQGRGGGLIGWALSEPLLAFLGPVLNALLLTGLVLWGLALSFGVGWDRIVNWLNRASVQLLIWSNELEADVAEREAAMADLSDDAGDEDQEVLETPSPVGSGRPDELIIIDDSAEGVMSSPPRRSPRLPPLTLLEQGTALAMTPEEIDDKKRLIESTLQDFGLPATVTEIRRGPAVTQFGVQPGYIEKTGSDGQSRQQKVRVGQIASLQRDLALALAVTRLRIEAPVPGRGIVGVEVPNDETSIVRLRPIIETEAYQQIKAPLTVALGRDVTGAPVATDLGRLPHLLIAGTTGSGKSVCLNALITCLALNNTPEQLRMVMIDPKKVELIRFNGMPHLLGRVETEGERVIGVLRWLAQEMDRRYEAFAQVGAKHLAHFNSKMVDENGVRPLPYIAVFVDELADLMHAYPADVERTLCRLAQMARATGIHLVVATQRPSTDVITGLIKANFPARASFAVASNTDSRVILDSVGAEQLLGKGDMLFLPPDASAPLRVQGVFVNDREIEGVVAFWQAEIAAGSEGASETGDGESEPPWESLIVKEAFISERDEMLEDAIALAQKRATISTSYIQRRLRVGYPRAARLMEALYEMGLVEDPKEGGKTRRTLVDEDDDPLEDYLDLDA
ncbi:MAG: DNA translocase FtsK 4TM domain-containing protein [Candidatus Promineifilaceae bacterium]|nr:DNA translocase FtsK 4TM domain-containing protein [Candidatus Promineifilaceae bacterium]